MKGMQQKNCIENVFVYGILLSVMKSLGEVGGFAWSPCTATCRPKALQRRYLERCWNPYLLKDQKGGCFETRPCQHLPPCGLPGARADHELTVGVTANLTLKCTDKAKTETGSLDQSATYKWDVWSNKKKRWRPFVESDHPFETRGEDLYVERATKEHVGTLRCSALIENRMGDQEIVDEILHHLRLKKGGDADGGLLDAGLKPIFILSVATGALSVFVLGASSILIVQTIRRRWV